MIRCVCVCSVVQLCPTLCDPIDCSPPGSTVHGIFQARILEWVSISYSKGSFQPKHRTHVSCIASGLLPRGKPLETTKVAFQEKESELNHTGRSLR